MGVFLLLGFASKISTGLIQLSDVFVLIFGIPLFLLIFYLCGVVMMVKYTMSRDELIIKKLFHQTQYYNIHNYVLALKTWEYGVGRNTRYENNLYLILKDDYEKILAEPKTNSLGIFLTYEVVGCSLLDLSTKGMWKTAAEIKGVYPNIVIVPWD